MEEKDRFGNKLHDLEKGREDQYFAQRDRELLQKLKSAQAGQVEETMKQVAHMRCPKCGERLATIARPDVSVEECPACHGIWLDRGELDRVVERETEGSVVRWLRGLIGA